MRFHNLPIHNATASLGWYVRIGQTDPIFKPGNGARGLTFLGLVLAVGIVGGVWVVCWVLSARLLGGWCCCCSEGWLLNAKRSNLWSRQSEKRWCGCACCCRRFDWDLPCPTENEVVDYEIRTGKSLF